METINAFMSFLYLQIESVRPNHPSRKRRSLDYNPLYHSRSRRALTAICPETPKVQTHLAGPHSTDVTLSNLLKYTQYEITVRVYNSFADGPKSEVKKFTTPQDGRLWNNFLMGGL